MIKTYSRFSILFYTYVLQSNVLEILSTEMPLNYTSSWMTPLKRTSSVRGSFFLSADRLSINFHYSTSGMWTSPLSGPWTHICNPIDLNLSDTWTTHCFKFSKLCGESLEAPDETVEEWIKRSVLNRWMWTLWGFQSRRVRIFLPCLFQLQHTSF